MIYPGYYDRDFEGEFAKSDFLGCLTNFDWIFIGDAHKRPPDNTRSLFENDATVITWTNKEPVSLYALSGKTCYHQIWRYREATSVVFCNYTGAVAAILSML